LNAKYGWEQTLKSYRVNTILLRIDTPLTGALKESSRWRPVYDDGLAIVFRPNDPPSASYAEGRPASAGQQGRNPSDREITKVHPSGPRTTTNTTRSESI
jgi:hypothetical protein